jgi:3-dehydrosphinganine reductase
MDNFFTWVEDNLAASIGIAITFFVYILYHIIFNIWRSCCKKDLTNKHVLITGGSEGLGLALACQFKKLGAKVSIISRNQGKLDQAASSIKNCIQNQLLLSDSSPFTASVDVCDEVRLRDAVDKAGYKIHYFKV